MRIRETLPVKLFMNRHSYGFLESDGGDVFVHAELFKAQTGLPSLLKGWEVDCMYEVSKEGKRKARKVYAIFPKEVLVDH